jgi:hypothetical protein
LQREIHAQLVIDLQHYAAPHFLLETLRVHRHVVDADIEQRKAIIAGRGGCVFALLPCLGVEHRNFCAGQDCA